MSGAALRGRRVVFVFGCLDLGGSERQGFQVASHLQSLGAEVQVVGLSPRPGVLAEMCREKNIPWHTVGFHWSAVWPLRLPQLARFARRMRSLRPDLLLPYYTLPNTVCGLTWRRTGAAACVWNQRDEGLLLTRNIWHRTAVRRTPLFIANSAGGRDFLRRTYGIPDELLALVHNGITLPPPLTGRDGWRERLGIAPGAFVACMIANFGQYKDHPTLLRAWQRIVAAAPGEGPPVLVLAGAEDPSTAALAAEAQRLGIDAAVKFAGRVDDVSGLLAASDLCVHSSRTEGLPNGVLEAMAAGLPVVGTAIPGIAEAVGEEGLSFLVPVGDHGEMAVQIGRFFRDAALRQAVGRTMRRRAEREFAMEAMCARTTVLLADVLERKGR